MNHNHCTHTHTHTHTFTGPFSGSTRVSWFFFNFTRMVKPIYCPTNSIKALKAETTVYNTILYNKRSYMKF